MIIRRILDWFDPAHVPALKGSIFGGAAWGFDFIRVGLKTAPSAPELLLGVPPERWAAYASMLAACVALVSLFSTLPRAFRAAGWCCRQMRLSIMCFAGRVRRAWMWIRERLR